MNILIPNSPIFDNLWKPVFRSSQNQTKKSKLKTTGCDSYNVTFIIWVLSTQTQTLLRI